MKNTFFLLILILLITCCENKEEVSSINPENWNKRTINYKLNDSLLSGTTYLSVYSQIYGISEHRTHDLTVTISMKNTDRFDTVFILKADYFNTKGDLIRTYFRKPIFLCPLETVEIVIDEVDKEGGTGANFLFDWKMKSESSEPYFESVMISTSGQQGLSIATHGIKIK